MEYVWAIGLLSLFLSGLVGIFVANNKGVSLATGFFLGFLLGPAGIIVVGLLNANNQSQRLTFNGTPAITNDSYRLFLTRKYEVRRNDVLGRYVVGSESFDELETALIRADSLESSSRESDMLERSRVRRNRNQIIRALPILGFTLAVVAAAYVLFAAQQAYINARSSAGFEAQMEKNKKLLDSMNLK